MCQRIAPRRRSAVAVPPRSSASNAPPIVTANNAASRDVSGTRASRSPSTTPSAGSSARTCSSTTASRTPAPRCSSSISAATTAAGRAGSRFRIKGDGREGHRPGRPDPESYNLGGLMMDSEIRPGRSCAARSPPTATRASTPRARTRFVSRARLGCPRGRRRAARPTHDVRDAVRRGRRPR